MEPVSAFQQGGMMGVAVLLFLANFVQNFAIKKSNESLVEAVKASNAAAVAANKAVTDKLSDLTQTLAEGQKQLGEGLSAVINHQEILATNQMNLTHTNNDIVRELITIIRDGER